MLRASFALALAALAALAASAQAFTVNFAADGGCGNVIASRDAPDGVCVDLGDGVGYVGRCRAQTMTFCEDSSCSVGCITRRFADGTCGAVPGERVAPMGASSVSVTC